VIAYFDSSSIVKWFFDEPQMDLARSVRDEAGTPFTSLVSFPEVMSAFNRSKAKSAAEGRAGYVWGVRVRRESR
jgi:predicted nucleic acid-binding protein